MAEDCGEMPCRTQRSPHQRSSKAEESAFDQMILYNNFVHISHGYPGPQRGLVLYDEGYEGGEIITEK